MKLPLEGSNAWIHTFSLGYFKLNQIKRRTKLFIGPYIIYQNVLAILPSSVKNIKT